MSDVMDPELLRRTACDLVRLGAATAQSYFGRVQSTRKSDDTPVTEADHATQEAILCEIAARYHGHAVITEEEVARPERHSPAGGAEWCWVVDPIDGTRNFGRGVRAYATSVAVLRAGRPVAGAIYDASAGVVYSASRPGGAFRDDALLMLADRPVDSDSTVAISSFRRQPMPSTVRNWMDRYLFRNAGSVALHLAWVAAGLLDAAYSAECKLWDVAAGALIIEEAGGVVTSDRGRPLWPVNPAEYRGEELPTLAGSASIHARLLATLGA